MRAEREPSHRRNPLSRFLLIGSLLGPLLTGLSGSQSSSFPHYEVSPHPVCDRSQDRYIYDRQRLTFPGRDPSCIEVFGQVTHGNFAADGDYTFTLEQENGDKIKVEAICQMQDIVKSCDGYEKRFYLPKKGDYVAVVGEKVEDALHSDHPEVHPASKIRRIGH